MGQTGNEYHLIYLLKTLVKFIGQVFYFVGRPFYILLESTIILLLLIFYQVGQLFLRRLPFLLVFLVLSLRVIVLKLRYYVIRFGRKPRIPTLPLFLKKFKSNLLNLPNIWNNLKRVTGKRLPKKQKIVLPHLPRISKLITAVGLVLIIMMFSFWFLILHDLPNPNDLISKPRPLSTHILDRNGKLLYKIYRNENRTRLELAEIPLPVQQATIAIEDAEFYTHPGFSVRGIVRAVKRNIARGELTGGSTITQQLVKNALLNNEKTVRRKFREIILSILTEIKFSKKEILTMYLNEVSYGGAAYGIEEASRLYFNKSARDLDLAQAALLAGLPAAPTKFSPFGTNPELAQNRQKLVLARMLEEGFISKQEFQEAQEREITFAPQKQEIQAPHFVMYVRQNLVERYGERVVEEGGLTVVTTLDLNIQEQAEKIVKEELTRLNSLRVTNGAVLVTRPQTGEILAMVGSVNYFNSDKQGNFNVTTALRQPGSAIKPVNYAYALSHGSNPTSIIADTPVSYNIPGQPPYTPKNYDNKFRGNVPLRTALGSSLNVPAVKTLASYGVDKMIEQGQQMGITSWDEPNRFGLSLTLGGGEVKMTDLAVVYSTLANYGKKVELQPIIKVTDGNEKILEENECNNKFSIFPSKTRLAESGNFKFSIKKVYAAVALSESCGGEQILDPRVAFLLTDILHDNNARIPAFGPNSLLVIPEHGEVAVKTGTTQNLRDNWAIGYTKDFVVAAWVGNNDNTPMAYVASGITGATPIWHNTMRYLLTDKTNHPWEVPAGLVKVKICAATGTLPCEGCPGVREEYFLEENQPKTYCSFKPIIEEIETEAGRPLTDEEKREKILEKLRKKEKD